MNLENKKYDVLVIGELNVDVILNKIHSFPEIGKEKIADEFTVTLGSSSAIFASNLSTLGAKVAFAGKIGNDNFASIVENCLKQKNVNTSNIIKDNSFKTGVTIVLNVGNDRAMITHPGAMEEFGIDEIPEELFTQSKHIHVSSIFLQPKLKKGLSDLFKKAKEYGLTTSLDPQWDPNEKWEFDYKNILPNVDVFLPNKEEILHLTSTHDIKLAYEKIKDYANKVIVKMGIEGATIFTKTKEVYLTSFRNENVIDAIGAGDSFDAGFIYKFIHNSTLEECLNFANLVGAINTTAAGGTGAFESFEKIKEIANNKFGVKI